MHWKSQLKFFLVTCLLSIGSYASDLATTAVSEPKKDPNGEDPATVGAVFPPPKVGAAIESGRVLASGLTVEEARSKLGKPLSEKQIKRKTGTEVVLTYRGLEVTYFKGETEMLQKVVVTGKNHRATGGLMVGTPEAQVIKQLGKPQGRGKGRLDYGETKGTSEVANSLHFYIRGKKVAKIEWVFYSP